MSRWKVKALDRGFAQQLLTERAHHVQGSLPWFDFISSYAKEDDRSVTICRDDEPVAFLCALQYRNLIQSLPYPASYSGLHIRTGVSPEGRRDAYTALFEHYGKHCDVMSICSSPFFDASGSDIPMFDFALASEVHVIDLNEEPLARTTSKFRNNLRRNLKKAELAGVEVCVEAGRKNLENWYKCYEKRMAELGGPRLPQAYFEAMFDHLGIGWNCSLISATAGDKFVGGIVTVQNQYCLDYYLSMFNRDDDSTQASTAAFYHLLQFAKRRGIRLLNLQSSPRSQVELIRFKEAWGAETARYHYLVKILNNREQILRQSPQEIQLKYPFHFVVPFAELTSELVPA